MLRRKCIAINAISFSLQTVFIPSHFVIQSFSFRLCNIHRKKTDHSPKYCDVVKFNCSFHSYVVDLINIITAP